HTRFSRDWSSDVCSSDLVNEVVNGILALPAKQRPLYAALPGGSANVFVRALGLPANPVEATGAVLEALHSGSRRTVNLGHIDGPDGGRYFTFCAGLDRKSTRLNSSHVKISYAVF